VGPVLQRGGSIVFGSSVSGDASSTSNDVEVRLAYNTVDESVCATLGSRLGKRLNANFQGSFGSIVKSQAFADHAKAAREDLSGRGYLGGCCCSVFGLAAS
jgi:hypothetical protein